jgi:ferric-dicitrate binding protein FerR (iron transport regulator)
LSFYQELELLVPGNANTGSLLKLFMEETQSRLRYLLGRYANKTASSAEEAELFSIIAASEDDDRIKEIMLDLMQAEDFATELDKQQWEPVLKKILTAKESNNSEAEWNEREENHSAPIALINTSRKTGYLKKWAIAASLLLFISSGSYFLFFGNNHLVGSGASVQGDDHQLAHDLPPGRNQATLTLADGSTINLESASNGTLSSKSGITIIKKADGQLLYDVSGKNSSGSGYNIISTPRGGKYEIGLADGSKVWLNAASSLKFPTSFTGNVRNVVLTGEGYFEVAKNASMPFHVTVNDMTVEVLGTHFNINAYADEGSIATTLLEGSVKIKKMSAANSASQTVQLYPGERADLAEDGKFNIDHHANMEEVVAWKDNNFVFNNADISTIMRQVSRWYDVEVDYRGLKTTERLTGKFSRNVTLIQLMDMLRYSGVNMKIENKKIIIW